MIEKFQEILGKDNVKINEPMSLHTTFKIGGKADYFLTPDTEEKTKLAILAAKEANLPIFFLGNGSNLLVGDKGIRGVVICLFKKLDKVEVFGDEIVCQSGALLSAVSSAASRASLSGIEFASGIPGTIGGALYMNAGAYGFEMKEVVKSVKFLDECGEIKDISAEECEFGYRKSIFTKNNGLILGCTLKLSYADKKEINEKIADFTKRRVSKQPLDKPSAGSTFKRPEGYFAGVLIEAANLKGKQIGGAQVSEKHAGFIINTGGATAEDVLKLIEYVKETVYKNSGVELEPEVKLVGEF